MYRKHTRLYELIVVQCKNVQNCKVYVIVPVILLSGVNMSQQVGRYSIKMEFIFSNGVVVVVSYHTCTSNKLTSRPGRGQH